MTFLSVAEYFQLTFAALSVGCDVIWVGEKEKPSAGEPRIPQGTLSAASGTTGISFGHIHLVDANTRE